MKIALIVPGGVDRSGTHRIIPCLLWLVERLVAAGDEVHIFALQQEPSAGRWPLLGAQVHNAGARPRRLRSLAQLVAEHRRGRFDVVHAYWAGGPGVVAAAFARLAGVPFVLTLPGGDLVAHADIGYGGRLNRRGRVWTRIALDTATRVVVPSERMREAARGLGVEAVRIPWGVATDHWPVSPPRRRSPGDPLRLIHVANLNRVKDQETLLRAMKALRDRGVDFRLDVIGLDTLDGAVQRRCDELGLAGRVAFHGFLAHAETRPWVDRADLMVVSSRHEAVPMVLLEAAVAGVPTVGTAVGQIADWASQAAVSVPIGNPGALADAIGCLDADEEERLRIARAAQALAVAENADVTADRTRRLYAGLAGER